MKLADVLEQYQVDASGFIVSRGQFCLERRYVPHFWDKSLTRKQYLMETCPNGYSWAVFHVTVEDRAEYPELAHVATVGVRKEGRHVLSWIRSCMYRY